MSAKVINFGSVKKATGGQSDPELWVCFCGCFTFELHDNQSIVCAQCGKIQSGYLDYVTPPLRPVI